MPQPPAPPRLDWIRIAAWTIAIAVHVAAALALLLPVPALRSALDAAGGMWVVDVPQVIAPRVPPPAPPEAPEAPALRPPSDAPSSARAPVAAPPPVDAGSEETAPPWVYDPNAGITLVVYSSRPEPALEAPDQPPAELPQFRAGFDPGAIPGLGGGGTGASVTFDVLVEPDGRPGALVVTRQLASERALEAAIGVIGQWRFVPALRNGQPVQGWLPVTLEF